MREPKTNIWTLVFALATAVVVSALDWLPRFGGVPWFGLFVIPVIWVALWSAEDEILPLVTVAVIVTSLVMIRSHVSVGIPSPASIIDRLIVVGIIWLTVLLAVLRKRARRTFKWITLAGRQWEPDNQGRRNNQKGQTNQSNQKAKTNETR